MWSYRRGSENSDLPRLLNPEVTRVVTLGTLRRVNGIRDELFHSYRGFLSSHFISTLSHT